jgi:hydrazine synthase alpha subunit-like protein
MKPIPLTIGPFVLLGFAALCLPASGAEPAKTAPVYVKKDTWHESMLASLEATFGPTAKEESAAGTGGFRPEIVRLTTDAQPVRIESRVDRLERLCLATLGRLPENGAAHFLNPRLFDKRGNSIELKLDGPMVEGKVDARVARATELKIDGTTYRGFAVSPGEVAFKLDGKYERLEVFVYYKRASRGLPPHAAVDCRPIVARASECRRVWDALWDLVAGDFRDQQSQIEMETERHDGVWSKYTPTWNEPTNSYYLGLAQERLELARKTLEFVQRRVPRPRMAAELKALEKRVDEVAKYGASSAGRDLFAQAVELRRRIIFSHPALDFDRLLLTKRPPPLLSAPGDNYYGLNNGTGPGLVILDDWKMGPPRETVLLEGKLPPGCAMHPDISFDGKRVVFAYADHTPPRERWQFFLYEIQVDGTGLRQITGTDDDPLAGAGGRMTVLCEDYDPCYLPDGGFAFISTRNQGGVRCHKGGRYCPTFLLYRCDADGSNVRQLSFGEANEWDPMMMPDGQVIWMRWDYINRPVIPTFGLWTTRPDGTAASHYFGNYTPNPCRICQPRPIPGSHKIVATTAGHHTIQAGSLILIDDKIAEDGPEAITRLTPEATNPESEADSPVSFSTPYPLSEDLFLAAFCPDPFPASMKQYPRHDAYGIYLVDTLGGRELIYRDPEISCFAPMPVRPRPMPPVLPSPVASEEMQAKGVFYLQDVYESTQEIPRGTIKRLRVNEVIPQPTQRVPYSSAVRFEVLKRVVGTVPVDDSGSVAFEAPAGVPLQFQALDQNGMAVMTMRTSTYLQPGEQMGCIGCHEPRTSSPAIRRPPAAGQVLKLEPTVGPRYEGGLSFAKTVQPVLDRYCIDCHGLKETAGEINLLGTIDATEKNIANTFQRLLPSTAYASLTRDGVLVKIAQYGDETWYSQPKDYFAHGGTLARILFEGHEDVELDPESRQRIIDWLDLNAQFHGTYSWNKDEWRRPDPEGEKVLRAHVRQRFGDELAKQPFAALVNVALPGESRILKAPLARGADGWGQIEQGGWKSSDEPDYRQMRRLVRAAIEPLPYHDIAGTCGQDEACVCLSCWVRKGMEERQRRIAAGESHADTR